MKKLILTILTIITILGVNAQGNNLQFNRALFETVLSKIFTGSTFSGPNLNESNAFIVPSGKVWKITSISGSNRTVTNQGTGSVVAAYISKNGNDNFSRYGLSSTNEKEVVVWLPEGNYDAGIDINGNNGTYNLILSGVEFNIVP